MQEHPGAPQRVLRFEAGRSLKGVSLQAVRLGDGADRTLIIGGVHGDEPQSTEVTQRLIDLLEAEPDRLAGRQVLLIAAMNPDGLAKRRRQNAAGVDLNRNFPASNWKQSHSRGRYHGGPEAASEPETKAIIDVVEQFRPTKIVTVHCISGGRACNNFDGPGEPLAAAMHEANGYPVKPTIGYPTPGSLGSWAGVDLGIAMVTLEMPAESKAGRCWRDNRDALLAAITHQPVERTARADR